MTRAGVPPGTPTPLTWLACSRSNLRNALAAGVWRWPARHTAPTVRSIPATPGAPRPLAVAGYQRRTRARAPLRVLHRRARAAGRDCWSGSPREERTPRVRPPAQRRPAAPCPLEKDERLVAQLPEVDGLQGSEPVRRSAPRPAPARGPAQRRRPGGRSTSSAAIARSTSPRAASVNMSRVESSRRETSIPGWVAWKAASSLGRSSPPSACIAPRTSRPLARPLRAAISSRAASISPRARRAQDKDLSRLGKADATARAFEQLDAKLLLQEPDLVRQCWLGHRNRGRRPGEVPVGGDRDGVSQLAEFHTDPRSKLAGLCLGQLIARAGSDFMTHISYVNPATVTDPELTAVWSARACTARPDPRARQSGCTTRR